MMIYSRFAPQWFIVFFFMAALVPLAQAQQTAVRSNVIGDKVYLEIDMNGLQANLDSLFAQSASSSSALGSLTWADLLDQGTSPGMDVSFFGYDLTGLGQVTSSATLTADSLVLNKDAQIVGRLSLGGVATLSDSLKVQGVVEFADSLRVVKSVSIGERLFVSGITTLGDSLHVVGNVDLAALFNVAGAATFGSTVDVSGVATFGDSLVVDGVAVLEDSLSVAGNAHLRQDLQVDGHLNLGGDLTVNGESTFNDTAHFAAPALFGDSASFAGNVNMAGALSVSSLSINGVTIPAMDDTDDLPEGSTNLYFTDSRARAALSGGTGVTITSGSIAIGQAVGTTDDVTFDEIAVDSISASGSLTVAGRVTMSDSLHVSSGAAFQSTLVADSIHVTDVINGRVGSLSNHDTDGLNEGSTNLYFTDSRARAAISGGTGVTITSGSIAIGQSVGTTDDVSFDEIAADSISASGSLTVAGRVTMSDSLHVSSGAVFQSTLVADSIVSSGLSLNGGVRIQDGNQAVGKVLTSDANGNASWQSVSASVTVHSETITINGYGGAAIQKPTNMIRDNITLIDDGSGWCTVNLSYAYTDQTGSVGNDVQRLFKLPAGYQFDLSYHDVSTTATMITSENGWSYGGIAAALADGSGFGVNSFSNWHTLMVVPYSATEFRIGCRDDWNYVGPKFQWLDYHDIDVSFLFKKN